MGAPGSHLDTGICRLGHRPVLKTTCEHLDGLDQRIYLVLKSAQALLRSGRSGAAAWFWWSIHGSQPRLGPSSGSRAIGPGPAARCPGTLVNSANSRPGRPGREVFLITW